MKLYLVRHGQIASNVNRVYSGRSEEGLTEVGREQARQAAAGIKDLAIDAVYCSPLRRTRETAEIIAESIGLPVHDEPSLIEFDYGEWAGKSEDEIARLYPEQWRLWNSRPADLQVEGRESVAALLKRVYEGMERIRHLHPAGNVLAVTHVAVVRAALMNIEKMDLNLYRQIAVPNAGLFKIAYNSQGWSTDEGFLAGGRAGNPPAAAD
jgi:broad specificity phosphatase PhoE